VVAVAKGRLILAAHLCPMKVVLISVPSRSIRECLLPMLPRSHPMLTSVSLEPLSI
jgi:hypothetical protein